MNDTQVSPAFAGRFQQVCLYIERHLDTPLSLETLSAIAHSSPYHFHRQFSAYSGVPLYRYIQWLRLRRACWRLAFNPQEKIIDIALDAGFQNPESFSRAFRSAFAQSPSQFRQQPDWLEWHRRVPKHTLQEQHPMDVKIIQLPTTQIARLRHRGNPDLVNETAAKFIAWRKVSGLSPVASCATWGISWDDPAATPADGFSFRYWRYGQPAGAGKQLRRGEWRDPRRTLRSGASSRISGHARAEHLVSLSRLAARIGRVAARFPCFLSLPHFRA